MRETEEKPYIRQDYTCESGGLAQIIIPRNATKDDLLALKEIFEVLIERKFKVKSCANNDEKNELLKEKGGEK